MCASVQTAVSRAGTIDDKFVGRLTLVESDPALDVRKAAQRTRALDDVLAKSGHVKNLVEECVKDLSAINASLKRELESGHVPVTVESALERYISVEDKVRDVCDRLSAVNIDFAVQARDRELLDHKFAAAVEQEGAARHAALHDVLTELPNRALFDDRLEHELAHAKRHGWTMAVMFMDLDDFKSINDTYGHEVGNRVLQTVASRLNENTRCDDTISRYGGDEFLFILTKIHDEASVSAITRKIIEIVSAPCELDAAGGTIFPSVNASIGIAIYPRDGDSAQTLLTKADRAMYRAKQTRSGYAFSI